MPSPPYPNAPLALVVVEVRYPAEASDGDLTVTKRREFRSILGDDWVIQDARLTELSLETAPAGSPIREVIAPRFLTRDRMMSVTVKSGSASVETTNYPGFTAFLTTLGTSFDALEQVVSPDAVTRVGLRYIDEIVVPGMNGMPFSSWRDWLPDSLLPPNPEELASLGLAAGPWSGQTTYLLDEERSLNLRWGHNRGPVVAPDGALRRPAPPPTEPVFFMDFDCSWSPSTFPRFVATDLTAECERLHVPMHGLFESLVTNQLREQIFQREGGLAS